MILRAKNTGLICIWVLTLIPVFLWLFAVPIENRIGSFAEILLSIGQITALIGTALFALTLLLSARLKVFEKIFHGLNDVYARHNQFGQLALILLLFHPLMLLPQYAASFHEAALFLLPFSTWAQNWGIFSLALMVLLIVLTLYLRPRYNIWKWTHKFMGLAFFLGALHVWMIPSDTSRFLPLRIYIIALAGISLLAFFYRTIFGEFLVRRLRYEITQVTNLNNAVTEITLKALGQALSFEAGQFVFIKFPKSSLGSESHPFSIVSSPAEPELRLAIKGLGDYTSKLNILKKGDRALIEGPFGVFTNKETEYKDQIWIAGGIGITPFLSMAQSLKAQDGYHIDLFYCVKNMEEAVYSDVLERIAQDSNSGLRLHIFCSEQRGRIDANVIQLEADHLSNKDFFLCAPPIMIQTLRKQLVEKKVPLKLIHSEEFNF